MPAGRRQVPRQRRLLRLDVPQVDVPRQRGARVAVRHRRQVTSAVGLRHLPAARDGCHRKMPRAFDPTMTPTWTRKQFLLGTFALNVGTNRVEGGRPVAAGVIPGGGAVCGGPGNWTPCLPEWTPRPTCHAGFAVAPVRHDNRLRPLANAPGYGAVLAGWPVPDAPTEPMCGTLGEEPLHGKHQSRGAGERG